MHHKSPRMIAMGIVVLVLTTPAVSLAALIVDVDNNNSATNSATFVASDQQLAQVFEVGVTGSLSRIDVQVYRRALGAGDLIFDLLPIISGNPAADLSSSLATMTFGASDIAMTQGDFLAIDLSALGISVSVGDFFAVSLRATAALGDLADSYLWSSQRPRDYEQSFFRTNDTGTWSVIFDRDLGLRTVVDVVSVPEPQSLALLCVGLLTLGLIRVKS